MAYINVSMKEMITLLDKNANYNRDRIKSIRAVNENHIEITVGVAAFLPDIKVTLAFVRFERGNMYFNIISNGGAKVLLTLVTEMAGKSNKYITLDKNVMIVDTEKALANSIRGMNIKDISISGEQIYFVVTIA